MIRLVLLFCLVFNVSTAFSQDYYVGSAIRKLPPCSVPYTFPAHKVYKCSGVVELSAGDNLYPSTTSTLVATGGFVLRGSNNIQGQSNKKLGLEGDIYSYYETNLDHVILSGDVRSQNYIDIDNSDINGTLTTDYGYVSVNGSTGSIGDVFSHNGVWMDGANVDGNVTTRNDIVSLTNVSGGVGDIYSQNGVRAENSTIEGDVTTTYQTVTLIDVDGGVGDIYAQNGVRVENSNVEGDVTTQYGTITIEDSSGGFGDLSAQGKIEVIDTTINGNLVNTWNGITLSGTTHITGDVTSFGDSNNGVVYFNDEASVDGICLYITVPEDACGSGSPPEPAALYHFDESSWSGITNEVIDSSGNGLHGVAKNGATTAPASNNSALPSIDSLGTCGYGVFDNQQNQYVEVADHDLLDMNGSFTISAWVRPGSYPSSGLHTILSKDTNYEFHINSQGKVFWWWEDEDGQKSITSKNSLPLNHWSFITVRYNQNTEVARLFIDASSEGKLEDVEDIVTNNDPLQIGQDQNYSGRAFDGFIDEIQLFEKALSKSEIEDLMAQRHQCSDTPVLQCFTDDFNSGNLSNLWVTSRSKGSFTPDIVSNRLRFTEAGRNQSTASSYQRLFPAANNLVEIEFDHFAYGGNGADGIAIVLSDATVTPKPGAFGGPLGYGFKSGEPGFAGGWLGIGIDEYGNYSNEGGTGDKPGRRRQSVALRGSGTNETGYEYLAGACNDGKTNTSGSCLDPEVDNNNSGDTHRYKIVVDSRNSGESNVEIFRKLGSGSWSTIVEPINVLDNQYSQSDIPQDFLLSITGSTGGSTNIHEIDNFQVCALDSRPIEDQIDHFRLTHSGQELTCNAESVLVEACLDATCSSRYTGSVTAHLTPATLDDGGWIGGNVVTFSGGSASFDIRKKQIGSVTLGVTGSSPTTKPFSETLCSKAGSGFSANNCELEFTSSGFDLVVNDKIANLPTTATLKAGGNCGPGFANESKSIAFWSTYESPMASDIVGSPKIEIAGTEIGNTESTSAPINVQFNSNGEAQLQLDYPDAGKLQLNVKYTGQSGEDDEGLVVKGDGQFVSFPQRLIVTAKNSANQSGACASANLSCSTFAKAGERFNIEVTAVSGSDASLNRSEITTPNYSDSIGFEHLLVAPNGREVGELALFDNSDEPITTPESVLLSPGETKVTSATISEVGVFSIKVTPPETYLGSNFHTIAPATSANIGRFYPAYFTVSDSSISPNLDAFCSNDDNPVSKFSYIGQSFTYVQSPELYLEPRSVQGDETKNYYHKNWWNYSTPWAGRNYIDSNSRNIVFEGDGGTMSEFASGRIYLSDAELIRYEKTEPAISPFVADFSLHLAASDLIDSDNVCVKTSDSNSFSDCLSYSFSDIDEEMELRWGRLLIHDTYGPEVSPIRQRVEVQHFENGRFTTNLLDSCTDLVSINRFDLTSDDYTVVTSGIPNPPEVKASLLSAQVVNGESWIEFSAPGAGEAGSIDTEIDLNAHATPWLIEDLNGAGTVSGGAQFGIYRGNDRVIWWNEQN